MSNIIRNMIMILIIILSPIQSFAMIGQKVGILHANLSSSTAAYPTSFPGYGGFYIDPSKYDADTRFYAIVDAVHTDVTSGNEGAFTIYDKTNSTNLNTAGYGEKLITSRDLYYYDFTNYVRTKTSPFTVFIILRSHNVATTTTCYTQTVRITQFGKVTKTRTLIHLGFDDGGIVSTYKEIADANHHVYTSSEYDGTVTVKFGYFGRQGGGSEGTNPVYAELWDVTSNAAVASSETQCSSFANATWVESGSISPTSGHEFTVKAKNPNSVTSYVFSAYLIIEQDGSGSALTKLTTSVPVTIQPLIATTKTYTTFNMPYDDNDFAGCTKTVKSGYTVQSAFATISARVDTSSGGTGITGANASDSSGNLVYITSGAYTPPSGDRNKLDAAIQDETTGIFGCYLGGSRMIVNITNITSDVIHALPAMGLGK